MIERPFLWFFFILFFVAAIEDDNYARYAKRKFSPRHELIS